jgi:hypothetical protein
MLKKILYSILPIDGLILIINSLVKLKSYLILLILPMLFIYLGSYVGLFMYSFALWKLPDNFPIPFFNPIGNIIFDRVWLIVGFILSLLSYIDDEQRK